MATLEKIRSKGVLVLVVIGLALLAFIVGDFFRGSGGQDDTILSINGEKISYFEYEALINDQTLMAQRQSNSMQLSERMQEQVRQTVYNNVVSERIIKEATENIGIAVSPGELRELSTGQNLHWVIQSNFANPQTGVVDRSAVINFLNYINSTPPNEREAYDQWESSKNDWIAIEKLMTNDQLRNKYSTLLMKAINVNSLEAKFNFENKKNTADVEYVVKSYTSISDSIIKVSSSELKAEYNKRKEQYKRDASRDIKYISFPVVPSQDDFDRIQDWISKQEDEFRTADDVADQVNSVSDIPYASYAVSEKDVDPDFKEFAFSSKKDSVAGPALFGNVYKMARIVETGLLAPDSANIRHIFVARQTEEATSQLADSLVNVLKNGADFTTLVMQYSIANTASQGGELGWLKESNVEKDMVEPIFYSNERIFAVKSNRGAQIIEVLDRTSRVKKVKLAVLVREVEPSNITSRKIYDEAREYLAQNNTVTKFEAAAQENGYVLRSANLLENMPNVNNISNSRKIVRWAFENEKSALSSEIYECGDELVIAALTGVHKEGYASVDEVKTQLQATVIADKKAEMLIKEFSDAMQQNKDMASLASAKSLTIDTLEGVNFSSGRTAIGNELAIVATAPFMKVGEVSKPLKGRNGVYVISPYNITESTATFDESAEKMQAGFMYQYTIPQSMMEILIEKSDIIDNRSTFY